MCNHLEVTPLQPFDVYLRNVQQFSRNVKLSDMDSKKENNNVECSRGDTIMPLDGAIISLVM